MDQLYRRHLPHWQPDGAPIFLTWRLYGSLPHRIEFPPTLTEGQRFLTVDRALDRAASGPTWLKKPQVTRCVVDALFTAADNWKLYELFAWVVMSNHVHVLLQPLKPLREVTRAIKSTSARDANRILGRTGSRFWQDESYDHWVRNRKEFDRIIGYIECNPVHAGLVERPEDWPWSSASPKGQVGDLSYEVRVRL